MSNRRCFSDFLIVLHTASRLVRFSRLLRDQTRWPDIIGRWDKYEFLLVLPETPVSATEALKDKVKQQVESAVEQSGEPECSAVFGAADWRKGDDAESLIERAEADLKAAGQGSDED